MTERRGRKAIIHIGPMKTGSTSIQFWLKHNLAALAAVGIDVPFGGVATNLSNLALALDPKERNSSRRVNPDALVAGLEALAPEFHTSVISGELMGQRMRLSEIEKLRALLDPFFDEWRIIVYLRRQDDLAVSRYSTTLKRSQSGRVFTTPLDYARILHEWGAVFGKKSIRPRLFAREALVDGDVVADFLSVAELPRVGEIDTASVKNPSLKPEAQAFLRKLGERQSDAEGDDGLMAYPRYNRLVRLLNQNYGGKGMLPSRSDAKAYVDRVRDSNEQVRAEWFPERSELFDDDFSKYPESASPEPSVEQQLEVALTAVLGLLADAKSGRNGREDSAPAKARKGKRNQAASA